ncbi:hypothetical protein NDU88_008365 [Pleurodeles waltl]|uniref:Uncharacterized protein n=1 Tax=Pleurodeles waltl TaxID=8319 RepID=A0AAV7NXR5_PLEWA|nr:hypothetical protein NDU88_008365 [Pleurodeles waltl]
MPRSGNRKQIIFKIRKDILCVVPEALLYKPINMHTACRIKTARELQTTINFVLRRATDVPGRPRGSHFGHIHISGQSS